MKPVLIIAVGVVILVIFMAQSGVFKALRNSSFSPTTTVQGGFVLTPFGAQMPSSTPTSSLAPMPPKTAIEQPTYTDIPQGFTRKQLSPFFRAVRISSVAVRNPAAPADLISLTTISATKPINLKGWYMQSNALKAAGAKIFIPKAVPLYNPAVVPVLKDISLASGATLNLYSTPSPLGFGFRLNSCTGYLNRNYTFVPGLPQTCAPVARQSYANLSGVCQDYIMSLGSCAVPSFAPNPNDPACLAFLNTLDYPGCVAIHKNDSDFLGSEWRVWLSQSFIDPLHDKIQLFDSKGLLVDEYIY